MVARGNLIFENRPTGCQLEQRPDWTYPVAPEPSAPAREHEKRHACRERGGIDGDDAPDDDEEQTDAEPTADTAPDDYDPFKR